MIQRRFVFKLIFFILLSTSLFYVNKCFAQEKNYSAMVMDVTGDASVQRSGKDEKSSLKIGDLLYPGDAVAVAKKSTLTINYLASSHQEKWPEGTKFSVGESETKNTPSGVEISTDEVVLPPEPSNEHMGGYMIKSTMPDQDFEEMLPKSGQGEEQPEGKEGVE
jgi:hypothetical protein